MPPATPHATSFALGLARVSFSYGRTRALRDVSVSARRGRFVAIIGPNAAGKSTLLKCVVGALRPQSGEVHLDQANVHRLSPRQLALRIAYVPQRSQVSAAFTVRQVVELGRYALSADPARIDHALRLFDLHELADRSYNALSVGQQSRVMLARAIAQLSHDGVLALDEPTAAMDLEHIAHAHRVLRNVVAEGGLVLASMHDLALAAAVADDIWLLHEGLLVATGSVQDVLAPSRLQSVFNVPFEWTSDGAGRPRLLADLPGSSQCG